MSPLETVHACVMTVFALGSSIGCVCLVSRDEHTTVRPWTEIPRVRRRGELCVTCFVFLGQVSRYVLENSPRRYPAKAAFRRPLSLGLEGAGDEAIEAWSAVVMAA